METGRGEEAMSQWRWETNEKADSLQHLELRVSNKRVKFINFVTKHEKMLVICEKWDKIFLYKDLLKNIQNT